MRTTIKNRMMIVASLLMMTFSFAMNANAETCTQVPTCAELGYTETSCSNANALKCPFDQTKLFCGGSSDAGSSGSVCPVGSIYYSDNTCSDEYNSSKTVVGVVVGEGLIVDTGQTTSSVMTWNDAINACKSIKIGGKTARVPTLEEGQLLADNIFDAINSGLSKIPGATYITPDHCWSSTVDESTPFFAWAFLPGYGTVTNGYAKTYQIHVRCVFDY